MPVEMLLLSDSTVFEPTLEVCFVDSRTLSFGLRNKLLEDVLLALEEASLRTATIGQTPWETRLSVVFVGIDMISRTPCVRA